MFIQKIVMLNRRHLRPETYKDYLHEEQLDPIVFLPVAIADFGKIIRVEPPNEYEEELHDLKTVMNFAIKNDCDYVRFVADYYTEPISELPVYDWGNE